MVECASTTGRDISDVLASTESPYVICFGGITWDTTRVRCVTVDGYLNMKSLIFLCHLSNHLFVRSVFPCDLEAGTPSRIIGRCAQFPLRFPIFKFASRRDGRA